MNFLSMFTKQNDKHKYKNETDWIGIKIDAALTLELSKLTLEFAILEWNKLRVQAGFSY